MDTENVLVSIIWFSRQIKDKLFDQFSVIAIFKDEIAKKYVTILQFLQKRPTRKWRGTAGKHRMHKTFPK